MLGMADLKLQTSPRRKDNHDPPESLTCSDQHAPLPSDSSQASVPEHSAQSTTPPRVVFTDSAPPSTAAPDPRLLLVDDNSINLKVLSVFARKASSTPSASVSSGREALLTLTEARSKQPFDLIFLDVSMPEMSGFEVAAKIRGFEATIADGRRTYICALTALVSADDRHSAFRSRCR